jgi:hypothetical protein
MLKTVSSITNAIGALNYKGTWNASTNTPALASGVGTKGDYYVVSVAGSTNLDGETLWGVGDWAVYNGAAWQKVEGGNTINATTVSASTSVTTPVIQATSSAGGTLKNNSGTAQLQWGSGGGSNLSLEVATNINPANAAVAISPTGTGTVTINPATASTMNNVAIGGTTPLAITGTTITATGALASGSRAITKASMPAGSILQVVQTATSSIYIGFNSTSFITTGLTASITPTSSTSKILVTAMFNVYGVGYAAYATIYRDSTNLAGANGMALLGFGGAWQPVAISYLDSPATTSSTAYTVYLRTNNGVTGYFGGDGNQTITITLMEVAV